MRTMFLALLLLVTPLCSVGCAQRSVRGVDSDKWIIAHRGASGSIAEHTLEAYAAAYFIGADMIEPDVVATRDGHIICLHDITLERVTNVEDMYPGRARADGRWYAIDFDLSELKPLRVDGPGQDWIGLQIPTLEEMLRMVRSLNEQHGTRIGVVPEMKKPTFHKENASLKLKLTVESCLALSKARDCPLFSFMLASAITGCGELNLNNWATMYIRLRMIAVALARPFLTMSSSAQLMTSKPSYRTLA